MVEKWLIFIMLVSYYFNAKTRGSEDKSFRVRVLVGNNLPPYSIYKWHPSGNLSVASGIIPAFLHLISERFHFEYSFVPLGRNYLIDDRPNEKGLISYLSENKGDLIIGQLLLTPSRFQFVDFTLSVTEYPFVFIIPTPTESTDESSLIKPFGDEVWILLLVSVIAVIAIWYLLSYATANFDKPWCGFCDCLRKDDPKKKTREKKVDSLYVPIAYAFTVLLIQGNFCPTKSHAIRVIALVWCLATFVLVPAYSGKLISFIMSPVRKPIVDTLNDVTTKVPLGLRIAIDRGLGADVQLQTWATLATNGKLNNSLGKMALAITKSPVLFKCNTTDVCVKKMHDSSGHIFTIGKPHAKEIIWHDLKHSGKCRLTLAKETYGSGYNSWALQKRSRFLDMFNKGILEIEAFGLKNYWESNYVPEPKRCLSSRKTVQKTRPISLVDLKITFVLFAAGCGLGIAACFAELVVFKCQKRQTNDSITIL